ncbi:MAG TPA: DNA repair protein RadA [Gammaproteobacteria bacterium]
MARERLAYLCRDCGAGFTKWQGQCPQCQAWNSIDAAPPGVAPAAGKARNNAVGYAGVLPEVLTLAEVSLDELPRLATGSGEFDRVLGGGLVPGSVVLVGGDPGIGKSTLLLQTLCRMGAERKALYVTGEESPQQVTLRAHRLGLSSDGLRLLAETDVERICTLAAREAPPVMVIDSIQTLRVAEASGAPGGVTQIRESAAWLTRYAKQSGCAVFLVGHVTKSGEVAGPRVLEHIVDTVLYLEGRNDDRYRMLRATKNRFGAVNELGVFAMTEQGMREVRNPSAIFLNRSGTPSPGSAVLAVWDGSRPLLLEIQALLDASHLGSPRRVAVGLDSNRLAMLLAVLHRHGGIQASDQDVFVNVVGGVRITETGADLALLLAMVSSLRNAALPVDLVAFGEVGLAGEIRPVPNGSERLQEAAKHGFRHAIVPRGNAPKNGIAGMRIVTVERLTDALEALREAL